MPATDDDDEALELDVQAVYKAAASDLSSVADLTETLARFGFSRDDRIERRELVLMYRAVEKEMEAEISNRAFRGDFNGAKEMRQRLTRIREEFDGLQTTVVRTTHEDQRAFMVKATKEVFSSVDAAHRQELQRVLASNAETLEDRKQAHAIQWDNLELEISRIPRPRMKYSKRAIELFRAESGLIRLKQYDDARKVRLMLDKMLPGEEARFYKEFDDAIEAKRERLRQAQAEDLTRLDELLKGIEWTDHRRRDREAAVAKQRVDNHVHDMAHAHVMESKLRPEMSVKPSALWQKRPGYKTTASSLRGEQLLTAVKSKGKADLTVVFTDTLTDKHSFDAPLDGTRVFR
jgi:hypothetical protein